ncbi:hypothetical protein CEXT_735291, partial [Caerostris extrusa]
GVEKWSIPHSIASLSFGRNSNAGEGIGVDDSADVRHRLGNAAAFSPPTLSRPSEEMHSV